MRESAEMYLETILIMSQTKPCVRAVDVASTLAYKKSSVSVAIKHLREGGYVRIDEDGCLHLTDSGKGVAEGILERHKLFSAWLVKLGVDEQTAAADACRIEHVLSAKSFEAIKRHTQGQ